MSKIKGVLCHLNFNNINLKNLRNKWKHLTKTSTTSHFTQISIQSRKQSTFNWIIFFYESTNFIKVVGEILMFFYLCFENQLRILEVWENGKRRSLFDLVLCVRCRREIFYTLGSMSKIVTEHCVIARQFGAYSDVYRSLKICTILFWQRCRINKFSWHTFHLFIHLGKRFSKQIQKIS